MKRFVVIGLTIILMAFTTFHVWEGPAQGGANSIEEREVIIIGPTFQTFDAKATHWDFSITAVSFGTDLKEGRIIRLAVNGIDILPQLEKPELVSIHRLDREVNRGDFKRWLALSSRLTAFRIQPLSWQEEREFHALMLKMEEIGRRRREIKPSWLKVNTAHLPFKVAVDKTYDLTLTIQAGDLTSTWEGSVLVNTIADGPNWFAADLHIHSVFSDGNRTPAELATMLSNRVYNIGYVTDEPAGWGQTAPSIPPRMSDPDNTFPQIPTWEEYRNAVRNASTTRIAIFPGLEIAASTIDRSRGEHNGHALAYGVQNLTGTHTFETTGLRYRWFHPNTLLNNINNNRQWPTWFSSGAIAHPTGSYSWNVWGSTLTARYDGIELMSGYQDNFHPSAPPMVKWREELTHRLSGVFFGGGFPSARTGSDYCGNWYSPPIQYYTFLRLPSTPTDWRFLPQRDVDTVLRQGRTIASRYGGLAIFTLNGREIGDWFTLSPNSVVNGNILLHPAISGSYAVTVYEDNNRRIVHESLWNVGTGQTINIPFTFNFPGGQRYYYVYVTSASEFIYTSPIFIRQ